MESMRYRIKRGKIMLRMQKRYAIMRKILPIQHRGILWEIQ